MDPTYKGEAMLLRWGETSTAGRTVTFIIEDGPDAPGEHPFKGFPVGKDGQRFALVAVPIGNDQKPVEVERPAKKRWHEMPRSQRAGLLCNDERFQKFVGAPMEPDAAAEYVRLECGITSRANLDSEPIPAERFDRLVTRYRQWAGLDPEQRS